MDFYGFYTGTEFHAHEYLGAHVTDDGVVFRVFAPAARGIAVIGEFNEWNGEPMHKIYDGMRDSDGEGGADVQVSDL